MVMALAETSRNVENDKTTALNNQQFKLNGRNGKHHHGSGKSNPSWKTFFKKSSQTATAKRNDENGKMPRDDKHPTNLVSRSSSVVIGKSRSNFEDIKNNETPDDRIYEQTKQPKNQIPHINSGTKPPIAPSISLYQVMKRENSFHAGMPNNRQLNDNKFSENAKLNASIEHRNVIVENQIKVQAKKCASESDLISADEYEVIHDARDETNETQMVPSKTSQMLFNNSNDASSKLISESAAQYNSDCDNIPTHSNKINNAAEGFYRSFDDDIDDIDLGVLANSNSLEASIVLRNQQTNSQISAGPYITSSNDKTNISSDSGARFSYNSSCDSGRTSSDTYAETSNSSVTSGFSNRVYSNTSNCSGDSGAQLSFTSETNSVSTSSSTNQKDNTFTTRPILESLAEQESPINTGTFKSCEKSNPYSTSSVNSSLHPTQTSCVFQNPLDETSHYSSCSSSSMIHNEKISVYNDTQGCICVEPCFCYNENVIIQDKHQPDQHRKMDENVEESNRLYMQSTPVLGPRFATVRKSLTLPHDINNAARFSTSGYSLENKTNDASNNENNNNIKIQPKPSTITTTIQPENEYSKIDSRLATNNYETTQRRKDLSRFLGVQDEGPGSPSKKVAQYIAMQNYQSLQHQNKMDKNKQDINVHEKELENLYGSRRNSTTHQQETFKDTKRKDIEHFLGIKKKNDFQESIEPSAKDTTPNRRPMRPKSLIGLRLASSLERKSKSTSQSNFDSQPNKHNTMEKVSNDVKNHYEQNPHNNDKNIFTKKRQGNNEHGNIFKSSKSTFAVNRTLTRFQNHFNKEKFHSAPTTPECAVPTALGTPPNCSNDISPRRKNLERFLGINNEHYKTLQNGDSVVLTSILQKKRLYSSTPNELEAMNSNAVLNSNAFKTDSIMNPQYRNNDNNVSTIRISTPTGQVSSSSLSTREGATHISIHSGSSPQNNSAVYANRGLVFRFTPSQQRSNSADRSQTRSQHSASIITINPGGTNSSTMANNSPCSVKNVNNVINTPSKDFNKQKMESSNSFESCACGISSPLGQRKQCHCQPPQGMMEWKTLPSMSMDRNFRLKQCEAANNIGRFAYPYQVTSGAASLPRSNHKLSPDNLNFDKQSARSSFAATLYSHQSRSLLPSSASQDSIKIITNDTVTSTRNNTTPRQYRKETSSNYEEASEMHLRRHTSSENVSSAALKGPSQPTKKQSYNPYNDLTGNDVYGSRQGHRTICCNNNVPSHMFPGQSDNLMRIRQKTDLSTCACTYGHNHCPCPGYTGFPGHNDYLNSSSNGGLSCNHHRYAGYPNEISGCNNTLPIIICRPEYPETNTKSDNGVEHHYAMHSNMYAAVPLIPPQTHHCSCLAGPSLIHDSNKENHRYYELYDKVSSTQTILLFYFMLLLTFQNLK